MHLVGLVVVFENKMMHLVGLVVVFENKMMHLVGLVVVFEIYFDVVVFDICFAFSGFSGIFFRIQPAQVKLPEDSPVI